MSSRQSGTVLSWDSQRGIGRITSTDGAEFWAHFSFIRYTGGFRALRIGQRVEFTPAEGPGPPDERRQAWDIVDADPSRA